MNRKDTAPHRDQLRDSDLGGRRATELGHIPIRWIRTVLNASLAQQTTRAIAGTRHKPSPPQLTESGASALLR